MISNISNISYIDEYSMLPFHIKSLLVALFLIFTLGVLLNIISIITISSKLSKSQPIYLLILNLSIADLIYSLSIPLFAGNFQKKSWPFGLIGCQFYLITDLVSMIVGGIITSAY